MRRRRILLLVAIALIVLVYGFVWYLRPRSTVTIRNAGPHVLHAVVIRIQDRTYSLGDVQVAESKSAKVHLGDTSRIGIEFRDAAGQTKQLFVPAPGAEGQGSTVTVVIKDDQIDKIERSTKPPE
jgi:hypothetical protein